LFLESHPEDELIKKIIGQKDAEGVSQAVDRIRDSQVIGNCLKIASGFCDKARQAAENLPDSRARKSFVDLADYMVKRRK
jgi:geranylgeranyl pyrophosphate synthase